MTTPESFAERMRARRIELGLSQRDLSKEADISPPQLSRYEAAAATPRADIASRIAKVLKVNLAWLINGSGTKLPQQEVGSLPTMLASPDCPCMMHEVTVSLSNTTYRKLIELAFSHGRTQPEEASELLSKVIFEAHLELTNERIVGQNSDMLKKTEELAGGNTFASELLHMLKDYQAQAIEREKSFKEYRELSKKHLEVYSTFVKKMDQIIKDKK